MVISYNWLNDYLPLIIEPDKLSSILTAVGLEVENLKRYERVKGSLKGLVAGEVISCVPHPNADKLFLTTVDVGETEILQIVCGAANVATGQKVIVAPVGTTLYPVSGTPIVIKQAKIRGIESQGMICAEDEIGIGTSHDGIFILPDHTVNGTPVAEILKPYQDWVFEIGLTPNRMDAMSHFGVARDVCAYLSHHNSAVVQPVSPFKTNFSSDNNVLLPVKVTILNQDACQRYSGVSIGQVTVKESPEWLKNKLAAIGVRPINNIVDVTNFILHETGQPLHAFDADDITGNEIIVKNALEGTCFTTLDGKERKLSREDLMISNASSDMCIAGVFGGLESGVKESATNIFLESAWFDPSGIRKTSLRHSLRTDAATRFEKGVDISHTVHVLKRAAMLIKEVAGGTISSDIVDVYPNPKEKTNIAIKYTYLSRLSGKKYPSKAVKSILQSLDFDILRQNEEELEVAVPFSKPDVTLPADIVEEILRIDGLDNVEISGSVTITPSVDENGFSDALKEKVAGFLVGCGFNEIVTNSITNSAYYSEDRLGSAVKMINNLSADLNVLRMSMVETGLEAIVYNLHRQNNYLRFFEFGKTYSYLGENNYLEKENLSLYLTGTAEKSWKTTGEPNDYFKAKGIASAILKLCGMEQPIFERGSSKEFVLASSVLFNKQELAIVAEVDKKQLLLFDIKQPVYYINFNWAGLVKLAGKKIIYKEISKFPAVQRDLSVVVDQSLTYELMENAIKKLQLHKLQGINLFDVFKGDKVGMNKKSMAINFIFRDEDKTLTDKEIEGMMNRIIQTFEKELNAETRK